STPTPPPAMTPASPTAACARWSTSCARSTSAARRAACSPAATTPRCSRSPQDWGLHSNGYTLARRLAEGHLDDRPAVLAGATLGEALLEPTAIYVRAALALL